VIDPVFLGTPLYRCEALEPGLGCMVSIKLETANPVRSFKARGTEVVASLLAGNGPRAVVCASAGNLGQALAWSGRGRGIDVTVVASRCVPAAELDRIRALDARLELVDGDFDMARERAAALARCDGIRLVEDSLDIETCEGAATIGLELADTAASFDAVLIALGGGALACTAPKCRWVPALRVRGVVHAAPWYSSPWYSSITPPSILRRCTGVSSSARTSAT